MSEKSKGKHDVAVTQNTIKTFPKSVSKPDF